MKKSLLLLIAAFMVGLGGYAMAGEQVSAPTGETSNPVNADYGGVDYWGTAFTNFTSTVALPIVFGPNASSQTPGSYGMFASTSVANTKTRWRIYGAFFSTGTTSDFIDVFQSTGGFVSINSSATLRLFNVAGSTGGAGSSASGFTPLRWPIRMYGNIFMKPSSNGYNTQGILYWKEPD